MDSGPARMKTITAIGALIVGVACFIALMVEGVPADKAPAKGTKVVLSHATKSGCPTKCKEPEKVETKTTVTKAPASPAEKTSPLEKALGTDTGVVVIRFFVALLAALLAAITMRYLFASGASSEHGPEEEDLGDEGGSPALNPKPGPPIGGGTEGKGDESQSAQVVVEKGTVLLGNPPRKFDI